MREFYVYEHWRSDRNEIFYIGKGTGRRGYNFKQSRNNYYKAIVSKLLRIGAFVEVKIVAKRLTEQEAFDQEAEIMKRWLDAGAELANLSSGGIGGHTGARHTEAWKKRHGEFARQWFSTSENKEKHRNNMLGKRRTEEQKAKLRGPKSSEHIEAMRRGAKNRKRPIPRALEHSQRHKAALAAWRKTPEFFELQLRRKNKFDEKRLKNLETKRVAAEAEQKMLAELRFKQFIDSIANGTVKVCVRCQTSKAPGEFSPNIKMKSGTQAWCKKCCAEYQILLRQRKLVIGQE